jgi:hypothetical protein
VAGAVRGVVEEALASRLLGVRLVAALEVQVLIRTECGAPLGDRDPLRGLGPPVVARRLS